MTKPLRKRVTAASAVTMQLGDDTFRAEVEFPCSFCSGTCWAGYMDPGDRPCVIHTTPHCTEFGREDQDAVDFLIKNRRGDN